MNGAGLFFLLLFLLVILPAAGFVIFTRWRAHQRGLPAPPMSAYNPFKAFSSRNRGSSANYPGGPSSSGGSGGGPLGWIKDKVSSLRDHRAGSGYAGARRGQRGFGPLDPDAAWDDRVALEADIDAHGAYEPYHGRDSTAGGNNNNRGHAGYEEQELGGMQSPRDHGPYGMHSGDPDAMPAYGSEDRGRTRSREDLAYHGASTMGAQELDARYEAAVHGASSTGGGAGLKPQQQQYQAYGGGASSRQGNSPYSSSGGMRDLSPRPVDQESLKHERRSIFREDV